MEANPQDKSDVPHNYIDNVAKKLLRRYIRSFLRLVGIIVGDEYIYHEDTAINPNELRADKVINSNDPNSPAFYIEVQTTPDPSELPNWFSKCGGLRATLNKDVVLIVFYLTRGGYANPPKSYVVQGNGYYNEYTFTIICLWEHLDTIAREYPEFAPLMILGVEKPSLEVVREEIKIVQNSSESSEAKLDLLHLVFQTARKYLSRADLINLFKEESKTMTPNTELDIEIENEPHIITGILREIWEAEAVEEAKIKFEAEFKEKFKEEGIEIGKEEGIEIGKEEGIEIGVSKGIIQGIEEGESKTAHELTIRVLTIQFTELPEALIEKINQSNAAWCGDLIEKALKVKSLEEFDWQSE